LAQGEIKVIVALETPDLRANWPFVRFRGLQMSCESATARDKSDHSPLFLSAWSTYRRGDAGAFAAPNRQAEGEVHAFIAGYRMTLGAAPSRFAPKMMAAEWRALWRFSALGRHIGETMQALSPRQIVRRKAKYTASPQDIA
jgi:hypothetical protein